MITIQARQHAVKLPPDRSPAGEAFNEVLEKVLHLHGTFTRAAEMLTKPTGQSLARWVVLAQCRDAPAPVSEIARRLRLARQSVQRIADNLVDDGLCAYRDNPHHQRAKLVELTETGQAILLAIDTAQRHWCDDLGGAVGEATLRRTASALGGIAGTVEKLQARQSQ